MTTTYQHTSFERAGATTVYLDTVLHLITQKLEIEPAKAKTEYVDLPGTDGELDLTEALGIGVLYHDRVIRWLCALRPGQDWTTAIGTVGEAINGVRMDKIRVDNSAYYYTGRVTVASHASDKLLHQITIEARVNPFRRRDRSKTQTLAAGDTTVVVDLGARPGPVSIRNTGTPLVAAFYQDGSGVTKQASVFAGATVSVPVQAGSSNLVLSTSGAGSCKISWQEVHL